MGYLDNSGLSYFWGKAKNYIDTAISTAGGGHAATTVNLPASGWSLSGGYYYKTVSVTGVTASNDVVVDTGASGVICSGQGAGTLTFKASAATAATVKVMIFT